VNDYVVSEGRTDRKTVRQVFTLATDRQTDRQTDSPIVRHRTIHFSYQLLVPFDRSEKCYGMRNDVRHGAFDSRQEFLEGRLRFSRAAASSILKANALLSIFIFAMLLKTSSFERF
jgi:hypothetical protein